jgi:formate dehydrogenase
MVLSRSLYRQFQRPAASLFASRPLRARAAPAPVFSGIRTLTATAARQGKVLLVLYDVSILNCVFKSHSSHKQQGGEHAKQEPALLGTTENELGIRKWLEDQGHTLVTTSDKEGENSTFDKELVDAEVIITTP